MCEVMWSVKQRVIYLSLIYCTPLAATGAMHGDNGSGSEGPESEQDPDLPALRLREDKLQQLIIPPEPEDINLDGAQKSSSFPIGQRVQPQYAEKHAQAGI